MRTYRNCYMLFSASFKLALMCCSCLHHILPWVASCRFVMHHAWLCIMSCICVVCLLCCVLLLDSSRIVAIVRIRSSTLGSSSWLHLLHGLVLLPSGISDKMTTSCFVLSLCCATYHLFIKPPILSWTSNLWHLSYANRCLAMLPLLLSPSYSIASYR